MTRKNFKYPIDEKKKKTLKQLKLNEDLDKELLL